MHLLRETFFDKIDFAFRNHQAVSILGPRQCGKTTLSKAYVQKIGNFEWANYFDLEDAEDLNKLQNPKLALSERQGLIVLDEIQRVPELFTTLRVLIDDTKLSQRFLILGSASRDLIQQASETLAGRIRYVELTPLCWGEVDDVKKLWSRGGFPKSYLAEWESKVLLIS